MRNINQFPIQKLPSSKKTQDWKESCVDYIIGRSMGGSRNGNNRTRKEEMQTYYDLYNSIYNEKDLKYVTNPFKQQDGFPAMAQDYNIVKPKIDLLLGEETKRPFNFKVVRTSEIATSEMQDKAKELLIQYIQATIMSKLGPEEQARYQQALQSGEIMPPEQIQKYMSKDYKDIAEITAYHSLNYLKNKLNITHEFYKGWKDALIGGEEIYYVGIQNGNPCLERINPIYFDYDTDTSDLEYIHDAQWCVYEMKLSATDIYDRYYDKLSEKQLNQLLDMMDDTSKGGFNPEVRKTSLDYPHIKTHSINGFTSNPFDSTNAISVWHCCWQSFRKIAFVTIADPETGEPVEYIVDESYNETGTEISVEWKWIIETWEGYRAGDDLYFGMGGSRNGNNRTRKEEMQTYYDLYNSIYNEKDLKYVTNPFKQQDGFPAMAQDYNIVKPKIDLLLGEETKRPFNFKVVRTSEIATSEMQDKAKELLIQYIQATIMSKLGPEEQARYQQALQSGEIMPPEQIQKYMSKDYKDIAEITAYHSLNYLKNKLNITHEFYKGWKDALIGGEEIYYVGIQNGNPCLERINPIYFDYDTDTSDLEYIHDAQWCVYEMKLSATDIYDRYYDKLSEKQLNQLLDMMDDTSKGGFNPEVRKTSLDYPHIKTHSINGFTSNPFDSTNAISVWHCCWQSFRKIAFVTIADPETGEPVEYIVDESYNETGTEISVEWKWIIETWEGYRAGDDLYFGMGPIEYQHVSADNPNAQRLPYTGVIYNNTNSRPRSLVSMMKPLQYMYIVLWYRLELAMSRDKGKVVNMDITQIPKSMNIDVAKWMHYLSALGVNFINPYEEGWDIPGREGGKPSQFNQITALDLTMANTIDQYIALMDKIEAMLSEITGVSKQREGSISSNELVGNVERSVVQSAHITEPWFWVHNQVKRECLIMLLNTAKYAWKDSKTSLQYVFDDATRAFMTLNDDMFYEDFDIFVEDTTKNQQQIEALKNLMQPAMQNGASLLDIAEIITLDNVTMIKNRLEEIEQKRMEQQQAMEQAQAEREQQMLQMQNEVKEEELMIKEAEMDLKKYEIDQNNATKITVAQLNAYRGLEDQDQNDNGIPDTMEIAAQALEERKQASEEASKQFEFNAKMREQQLKKEIEDKKIELEKQKLQAQKDIQKQKDDAALERERIKARTALKNKVAGEK